MPSAALSSLFPMPRGATNAADGEKRRDEILAFMDAFIERHGYSPTIREIADGVGLVSPGATHRQVEKLVGERRLRKVQVSTSRAVYVPEEP